MRAADQTPAEKAGDKHSTIRRFALQGAVLILPLWLAVVVRPRPHNALLAAGLMTATVAFIIGIGALVGRRVVLRSRGASDRPPLTDLGERR